jgi:glycosyltransferase involved in cell wall biosynthesis
VSSPNDPVRVMFLYWGRRGLSQFAYELARTALNNDRCAATFVISRQNENFAGFNALGRSVLAINTFASNRGALTEAWRIPQLRRHLGERLVHDRTQVVIELMPHIWSPFVIPVIKAAGVRFATIVHDATVHPGDYRTGAAKYLLDRSLLSADAIIALSDAVAMRIKNSRPMASSKVATLFHPDLRFVSSAVRVPPIYGQPVKVLWLGRIMPYKGLELFIDAIEALRLQGISVEVGVFGEGDLGGNCDRLTALGATVVNRWLSDAEIADVLPRYHAMVLSHTEASQSGIVATAFGAGMPVVATPVGGLVGQVHDGVTGMLASEVSAQALSQAIKRLLLDPVTYSRIVANIEQSNEQRSMTRFLDACIAHGMNIRRDDHAVHAIG